VPDEVDDVSVDVEEVTTDDSTEEVISEEQPADGESGTDNDQTQEEYFLEVNDRSRYRTREEALEGFRNAGERIASYSRLGSPEELRALKERDERFRQVLEAATGDSGSKSEKDPFADLSPEEKKHWDSFLERFDQIAPSRGFVRADDMDRRINEVIENTNRETSARTTFQSLAEERGVPMDSERLEYMGTMAYIAAQKSQELNDLFFKDPKAFAKEFFDKVYGPAPTKQTSGGSERDEHGRFKSKAAYQDAKERTGKLPTPPPKSGSAAAKAGEELPLEDRVDPVKRRGRLEQFMADRFGG
jgi:hypothetical protein